MPHTAEAHRTALTAMERIQQLMAEQLELLANIHDYDESAAGSIPGALATLQLEIPEALAALRRNTPEALKLQRLTAARQSQERAYQRLHEANQALERARSPSKRGEAARAVEHCRQKLAELGDTVRKLECE